MAFPFFKRAAPAAPAVAPPAPDAPEARAGIGEIARSGDGASMLRLFGGVDTAGVTVTLENALSVPAVWAAVGFLSRTMASLPVGVFDKTEKGREARQGDRLAALLNEAPNPEASAFAWRRALWQDVFTAGRHVSFIERNGRGEILNFWPLEISKVTVRRSGGRRLYDYRDGSRRVVTYAAADVLDLSMLPAADGLSAHSPIYTHAGTIGLGLAVAKYGRRFFNNGGVPAFTISGPIRSASGAARAAADMSEAVAAAAASGGNALALPEGHELKALGLDPEKMQMIESQRFVIEEIARIYGLPPVFIQDLTHGTFSNTEQQDLHFVKHALSQWVALFEGEINLKIFGRGPRETYAENAVAGILRGDLLSRAAAVAQQISTGQLTPNEARRMDNRPDQPEGDRLYMQGAMAPLDRLGQAPAPAAAPAEDTDTETEGAEK